MIIEKKQNKFRPFIRMGGICGEVDVNYPNTVFPLKDGFGFVIRLKNL